MSPARYDVNTFSITPALLVVKSWESGTEGRLVVSNRDGPGSGQPCLTGVTRIGSKLDQAVSSQIQGT